MHCEHCGTELKKLGKTATGNTLYVCQECTRYNEKTEMKCDYCGKEINGKPKKVGPERKYCGNECFYKYCLKRHKDTPLEDIAKKALEVER